MKKLPAAMGIILILLSVFLMIGSTFSHGGAYFDWNSDPNPVQVIAPNSWNVTRAFESGDWFKLKITPSKDWSDRLQPSDPSVPGPYKPVFVNITDPNGEDTEILVDFILMSEQGALVLYNITITETHGLTDVHYDPPIYGTTPGIVAKTLNSGNYTGSIEALIGGGSAPFDMTFVKGAIRSEKVDYSYLLYPGMAVFVVGVVLVVYGFKREGRVAHRRKDLVDKKD